MSEGLQNRSDRSAPFVFALALPLGAALGLLPGEFTHYKRWLELGSDETALRLAVLFAIFSKTLVPLLSSLALLGLFARSIEPRTLRIFSLLTSFLVLGFLGVDLELQKITGNNISDYLPYLLDPATFRWAGEGFDAGPGLLHVARNLVLALAPAGALAWMLESWVARSARRRGRISIAVLVGFALVPLVAAPFLQQSGGSPGYLYHLNERLPWTWNASIGSGDAIMEDSQLRAQELYARTLPWSVNRAGLAAGLAGEEPVETPDIVLVMVESLRHDALDRETMPNVWALSERGVRFENHYATSNASHYGLFALLYGRSPLRYFETLESEEQPTLPTLLHEWGYTNHYLSCADIHWREMDRFLGAPHFSVERMSAESLEECDREVMARGAALLEPGSRPPRLVLIFLMSTHFGYHYPVGVEPFAPALPPPNAIELDATLDREALVNRYRNSAHFVDSLIGSFLDDIEGEDKLVVVTGDHGESLFDDGTIAHSSLLSEIQTRVPLAMSGPGFYSGASRKGPTDHSDLLPTLLARLGIDQARLEDYPGHDLLDEVGPEFVPLVRAKARRSGNDHVALVSAEHRYSIRLDATRAELRFLGKLGKDGRPSREPMSEVEGARALRWFDQYLNSVVRPEPLVCAGD